MPILLGAMGRRPSFEGASPGAARIESPVGGHSDSGTFLRVAICHPWLNIVPGCAGLGALQPGSGLEPLGAEWEEQARGPWGVCRGPSRGGRPEKRGLLFLGGGGGVAFE